MAATYVQSGQGDSASSTEVTATMTSVAGTNALVAYVAGYPGGETFTVSDNQGNTWTRDEQFLPGANQFERWSAPNCAAATTIVSFKITGAARRIGLGVIEASGMATSNIYDTGASTNGTSQIAASPGINTAQADEILVAMVGLDSNTPTWESDYTSRINAVTGRLFIATREVAATLSGEVAQADFGGSVNWVAMLGAYKGATAATGASRPRGRLATLGVG